VDFPTRAELFEIAADDVLERAQAREPGRRISPEEVYTEGSDVNILLSASSAMADEVVRQLVASFAALFLATAEEADLDRLVFDRYSAEVVRRGATAAIVPVVFRRTGGALAALPIPVGTTVGTGDGVTFRTVTLAAFGVGEAGPVTVFAQCTSAGIQGNVAVGTVTELVDALGDPNVVITNEEPGAGGDDTESDASLRDRARRFLPSARRGTVEAIRFGALTVEGVRQATVVEDVDTDGNPTGRVTCYIADANGQANAALVDAVRTRLVEYRAAGVVVDVYGGTPTLVPIVLRLRFAAGFDSTLVFDSVRRAIVAAVNVLPPGETLTRSLIIAKARSVPGAIVLDDAVVAPVGDVVPVGGEVLRTAVELVTPAVAA